MAKLEDNALRAYEASVAETDVLPSTDVSPVLLGLFGEIGSLMAATKKLVREARSYPDFRTAAGEEFGDALWYFASLCRRLNHSLARCFAIARESMQHEGLPARPIVSADQALFSLGRATAELLSSNAAELTFDHLLKFAQRYLAALRTAGLDLVEVIGENRKKTLGAFGAIEFGSLPRFDDDFDVEERIPESFRLRFNQRSSGRSYIQYNGVFIGDPLTDNIGVPDGYRFHDVFHAANAAILHWSPVFRALLKQKRKSDPAVDEAQDGGRAIVIEEGLTAWLFSQSKTMGFFEGQTRISLGTLKVVQQFVAGYEVSECPLNLWERSILQGYAAFRALRSAGQGWIVGDRLARTIAFEPL